HRGLRSHRILAVAYRIGRDTAVAILRQERNDFLAALNHVMIGNHQAPLAVCHPTGTGWVADRERRLVITNHDVIKGGKEIVAFLPQYSDGSVATDAIGHSKNSVRTQAAV